MTTKRNESKAALRRRIKALEGDLAAARKYKHALAEVFLKLYFAAADVVGDAPPKLRWLLRHELVPNTRMDAMRAVTLEVGGFKFER